MKQYRLIQNLQLLKVEELKEFDKWLNSRWCNTNGKIVDLFSLLRRYYPDFTSLRLTKRFLFSKLYPEKVYNDRWVRNLMSELNHALQQFYIDAAFKRDTVLRQQLLIQSLLARDNPQAAIQLSTELLDQIGGKEILSSEEFLAIFLLNDQLYYQPNTTYRQEQFGGHLLRKANTALDDFYLLNKLRLYSELKERDRLNEEKDTNTDLLVLRYLFEQKPQIATDWYLHRLNYEGEKTIQDVEQLISLYKDNFHSMSVRDQQLQLWYLINDCSQVYKQGFSEVLSRILDLYKFGMAKNLLITNGKLTESTYLNIVGVSNALGDFRYVQEFIFQYTCYLPRNVRGDAEIWAKAHCYYHQGFLEDALNELTRHEFEKKIFIHRARILELQIYFEIYLKDESYYTLFNSNCSSLEGKMRRESRLSEKNSQAIIRLIQYVRSLGKLLWNPNTTLKDLEKLTTNLKAETNIQGTIWLETKIKYLSVGLQ